MIITLCGSARFEPWFHAWNEALSLAGHCVFGLAAYPSQHDGTKEWYTQQQKEIIDAVHLGKIATSHAVLVLNVFAYIGESTLKEIEYALSKGKETYFLESWGAGYGLDPAVIIVDVVRLVVIIEGHDAPPLSLKAPAARDGLQHPLQPRNDVAPHLPAVRQ